jgi:hypothetical protein
LAIAWYLLSSRLCRAYPRLLPVHRFTLAALSIAVAGAIIDQAMLWNLEFAAGILKYYWYRLSDAVLPAGSALTLAALIVHLRPRRANAADGLLLALMLTPTVVLGITLYPRYVARADVRPRADRRWVGLTGENPAARVKYENWRRVCHWIQQSTRDDALFITPRHQQTFKWYAQRAEVVNWKDVPQDAPHIVEWRRRLNAIYAWPALKYGVTAHSDRKLMNLARRYKVQYILVERQPMRRLPGPEFREVYPALVDENDDFAVYEVRPPPTPFASAVTHGLSAND